MLISVHLSGIWCHLAYKLDLTIYLWKKTSKVLAVDSRPVILKQWTCTSCSLLVCELCTYCCLNITEWWQNISQTTEHLMNQTAFWNKLIREAFYWIIHILWNFVLMLSGKFSMVDLFPHCTSKTKPQNLLQYLY